jgi:integrase
MFLEAAKGDRHECLYILSLTCGLRMGEALGLKWSDIDKGTLRVNRQIQRMRRDEDSGASGTLEFSEPKNASRRTIDLPQRAVEALRSHRKRQLEEGSKRRTTTRTQDSFSPRVRALRSTRRTWSTATSSRYYGVPDCRT